jgi:hypothetical protein
MEEQVGDFVGNGEALLVHRVIGINEDQRGAGIGDETAPELSVLYAVPAGCTDASEEGRHIGGVKRVDPDHGHRQGPWRGPLDVGGNARIALPAGGRPE